MPTYTAEEKALADKWLVTAARHIARTRNRPNCKRQICKNGCMSQQLNANPAKDVCGHPLQAGDVALTIQLALFGILLEQDVELLKP